MHVNLDRVDCWASEIGGCRGKLSREHLISKSLFPGAGSVSVSGFPWCNGETRMVGMANLTSKILCVEHNSLLSPLDSSAGSAFDALRDSAILNNTRQAVDPPKYKVRHFRINGLLLERWLLKTLINLCRDSEFFIGQGGKIPGLPDENLVRICFGKALFYGKSGMYLTARVGTSINSGPEIRFTPIIYEGTHIAGGFFHFYGFCLFLSLMNEILPDNFDWISNKGDVDEWSNTKPTWHFRKIKFIVNNTLSHVVQFKW